MEASVKIFRFESGFLAVLVYFRISITSYGCCPVDDPVSNKLRIMPDLQYLQTVAAMEYPFPDIVYIFWQTYIFQLGTFEKGTVFQHFQ